MLNKTMAMKILDQKKIKYQYFEYDKTITDGEKVAELVGKDKKIVFKTLVTEDQNGSYYVFCIPVGKSLDLKKVAKLINKKSIDMIKQKDLEPLTGYIHGGCSPIGMKKKLPTYFDKSIEELTNVCVSGGRVGLQIEIETKELIKVTQARVMELTL